MAERVLSGIRPTGRFHLGNYLGALKSWAQQQYLAESFYMIVDLHALADNLDPDELKQNCINSACFLLAIGIDPEKSVLFLQSQVPYHTELTWILSAVTNFGELNRMTQFKEKAGKKELASVALFTYPVLMAADILLYRANKVPVGEDQKQHLELTRDVAGRFNKKFGEVFVIPEPLIPEKAARVMDLQNPEKKMSKSEKSDLGIIYLDDDEQAIKKKISKAVTDSSNQIVFDPDNRPGVSNLLSILGALTDKDPNQLATQFQNYKDLKEALVEQLINELTPIREKYLELKNTPELVKNIIFNGSEKAKKTSKEVLIKAKSKVGLFI